MIRRCALIVVALAAVAQAGPAPTGGSGSGSGSDTAAAEDATPTNPLATYYAALAQMKLVDVEGGTLDTLKRELGIGEDLLRGGAYTNAAVALYAIVESPRYSAFTDFVEFQNAQYDLAVALYRAGSYNSALDVLADILRRGPGAPYWGPAHRRAVDIALETRDYAGVLARLEAIKTADPIPPSASSERDYLRGRAAYEAGKLTDAEGELVLVSKKSRLYSSAVYLRGVIRARRGQFRDAAEAMCEIAGTPDNDKLTFVVDDRYFTLKDLARLGLGRIAHEEGEYDDAYYHFFQIPDDSPYLPDALFEAAWSMYQKRELDTSRDLVHEFLKEFPNSPLWPEASLLAGYVELADCKFDDSKQWYDTLITRLTPIVAEIEVIKKDPALRRRLFAKAVERMHAAQATGAHPEREAAETPFDAVVGLLRLDPGFVRLDDAVSGAHALADGAPQVVRTWQNLAMQVGSTRVAKIASEPSLEQEQLADATSVLEDLRRLRGQVDAQLVELSRARADHVMAPDAADAEIKRLTDLRGRVDTAIHGAEVAADQAAQQTASEADGTIRPLIQHDLTDARHLDQASHALAEKLDEAGEQYATVALDKLYEDTRRVLDKAKLGKIDAVIGQKRKLDIEVQDLAAGRFPEELVGRLWNAGMIGDDEELWPFEGEFWIDEYEGWR